MIAKLAALALVVPVAATTAVVTADYAIIDIREKGPKGHHLVVPVPLALAKMALSVAPPAARRVDVPHGEYAGTARLMVAELRQVPDFEMVRIETPDESVRVRKEADALVVQVDTRSGEHIQAHVPLEAADQVLAAFDGGTLNTAAVVAALKNANGALVRVTDNETEVSVRIW